MTSFVPLEGWINPNHNEVFVHFSSVNTFLEVDFSSKVHKTCSIYIKVY